jgi:hypothetical protein
MKLPGGDREPDHDARFFSNGDHIVVRNSRDQKIAEAFRSGRMVIRRQDSYCIIDMMALLKALKRLGDSTSN